MPRTTVQAGKLGEDAAITLLNARRYKIIERNFRTKFGEIDIIAEDGNILVFIEVKTRWSKKYGYPEEAVDARKLRSIIKTGEYYKLSHPNTPDLMRIDVVAVGVEGGKVTEARIIQNVTG